MEKRPIAVIAACRTEMDFLKSKLDNLVEVKEGEYTFYEGKLFDFLVVIAVSNIGLINAAVTTYITINKYNPIAIINEGTSGAHGKNIHTGDIVIGEKCFNIGSCKTPKKALGEGSNSLEWNNLTFIQGEKDRPIFWNADVDLLELAKRVEYNNGQKHIGIIGSGDIWNSEVDKILSLNDKYGTLCEEMEGISVYTVANKFNVPIIGIRVISNNEILGEKFDNTTGLYSQIFTYDLIRKIIEVKGK